MIELLMGLRAAHYPRMQNHKGFEIISVTNSLEMLLRCLFPDYCTAKQLQDDNVIK